MAQTQDFEKKVELGLRLNSKLIEFSKTLSPEEQKGVATLMRLAEFAVENGGVALFGLENREIVRKVRRKLFEFNCDISSQFSLPTTPTVTTTLMDLDVLLS